MERQCARSPRGCPEYLTVLCCLSCPRLFTELSCNCDICAWGCAKAEMGDRPSQSQLVGTPTGLRAGLPGNLLLQLPKLWLLQMEPGNCFTEDPDPDGRGPWWDPMAVREEPNRLSQLVHQLHPNRTASFLTPIGSISALLGIFWARGKVWGGGVRTKAWPI